MKARKVKREVRLLFVGFHATPDGSTPESQNELVAKLLQERGFSVHSASAKPQQLRRLLDQLVLVLRNLRWADAVIIDVFSGRRAWTPFLVTRITRRAGIPTVLVLHGGGLPEYVRTHRWRIESTLRLASRVVAPSPYLKRQFDARGFTITELPNLVDIAPSEQGRALVTSSVLWMRSFDTDYQPALAIEAFAILSEQHPEARLTMAGTDRGLLAGVRRLARERGVLDRMSLPGYLQAEEKARALREHSVFLNTTRVDNTPVSVIEAMAAGLPVVATNVGGMSDLLRDGRAGLLVKDGDASGLALAMSTILDDAELRARLVQSGAEVAAHFAPEAVVQAWTSLLESVGVPSRVTQDRSCGSLGLNDLDDVVDIHCEAFPDSAVTHLGRAVVHRYYRWQFTGPHPSPVALGAWDEGQLVGFLFGGVRRGAVSGFARQSAGSIAWGALCHPHAVLRLSLPKAVAVGRALLRSHRKKPVPGQVHTLPSDGGLDTVARSFGILSLAVSLAARGSGAAAKLVADAEARAIIAGCGQMNLSVDPANHRAIRFYEKLGWQRSPDGSTWNGAMIKPLSIDEQEVDGLQGIHRVDDREC